MLPPLLATQANVAPGVVDEPLNAIEVVVQVNTLSIPAFTFGGVLFKVTKATSEAVQPLDGSVTVKVYVPAAFTDGVAVVPPETMLPPLLATQANVAPSVVDEPLNAIEVVVHVKTLSIPAFTFGGVLFKVTKATSVAVHKVLIGFITVKVYVPAALTIGVAVLAPETM
jgi:hypothetical protein